MAAPGAPLRSLAPPRMGMAGHVPLSGLDRRHAKSQGRVAAAVARGRPRASRDADLPSALARMVRFLPCADMTHLRACPLVGRLRARDVRTRVSVSGRIGPEGAGEPRHVSGRVAAAVARGRSGVWRGFPHRPSGRRPFFRGSGGAGRWGGPDRGRSIRPLSGFSSGVRVVSSRARLR